MNYSVLFDFRELHLVVDSLEKYKSLVDNSNDSDIILVRDLQRLIDRLSSANFDIF